jgi:hypothetical protein
MWYTHKKKGRTKALGQFSRKKGPRISFSPDRPNMSAFHLLLSSAAFLSPSPSAVRSTARLGSRPFFPSGESAAPTTRRAAALGLVFVGRFAADNHQKGMPSFCLPFLRCEIEPPKTLTYAFCIQIWPRIYLLNFVFCSFAKLSSAHVYTHVLYWVRPPEIVTTRACWAHAGFRFGWVGVGLMLCCSRHLLAHQLSWVESIPSSCQRRPWYSFAMTNVSNLDLLPTKIKLPSTFDNCL